MRTFQRIKYRELQDLIEKMDSHPKTDDINRKNATTNAPKIQNCYNQTNGTIMKYKNIEQVSHQFYLRFEKNRNFSCPFKE
ncbi:hypothetical protein TEHD86_1107 [Tetragenococcus halophilus subsp. halophilus]|nr:hypothetical protein TEH11_0590 [Tetragenococcus halophilus subsp. halophilus]GBD64518.1 hypothetical protein TEHD23766T_1945 [Tetragenococcus halophilus subsp. flandriensis]GEQ37392.1 hypothetical protein TH3N_05180 [Tetragenococcus halophilus]GBD66322.1 hypothetical protein TEHN7116_1286 [Tetragenococcus halophilus subsp. halophilus]GBD78260.1 hypothetical protein TEHN7128_1489 [Tetragenococcus halophilus subsp. halophilus]